ncbi:MAG: cysteine desulfurase [Bryobacterales bacterium]|nr:cysteine desulfurase [Bryobacterales bacterium]
MESGIAKILTVQRVYFDHNATTPVSPEVLEAMLPCFDQNYGNASSIHHFGQVARQRMEDARALVAGMLHCRVEEVVFTSGGTEADNLAILGTARSSKSETPHVITTAIEHPAVLNACAHLEEQGVAVTYVPAGVNGCVDPEDIRRALRPSTVLISVMHANNELGTVQPVAGIAAVARQAGVRMHSDGVQAVGKVDVDVEALGVDLYSLSGHKIGAPKGIGALFVRKGVDLTPLQFGGRHERGRRPGTENVAGAAALGRAAQWVRENLAAETARLRELRDRLESGILARVPWARVNAGGAPRTPNTSNIRFEGISGEALVIALDLKGFAVSTGAACSSGAVEPSHVLTAIGLSRDQARASIRFSLGRGNTAAQVDELVEAVEAAAGNLRRISPAPASV